MSYNGQPGGYPQQGVYPPQGGCYQQGGYPMQAAYPQQGGYPQQGYPPGGFPQGAGFGPMSCAGNPLGNTLMPNQTLSNNQSLRSQNGLFQARMQADNNFVIYKTPIGDCDPNHAIWSTNTSGSGTNGRLVMQSDHNLVVYDQANSPLWASNTNGRGAGNVRLVMQDDGNLVLYDQVNQPLWASNTCGR